MILPQYLQFTVRILQYRTETLHTQISYFIPRQSQFFQVWGVWSQSWRQSSTTFICDATIPQPVENNDTLFTLSDQISLAVNPLIKRKHKSMCDGSLDWDVKCQRTTTTTKEHKSFKASFKKIKYFFIALSVFLTKLSVLCRHSFKSV